MRVHVSTVGRQSEQSSNRRMAPQGFQGAVLLKKYQKGRIGLEGVFEEDARVIEIGCALAAMVRTRRGLRRFEAAGEIGERDRIAGRRGAGGAPTGSRDAPGWASRP